MENSTEGSKAAAPAVRVLVVDDHPVVRVGLKTVLGGDARVTVVGDVGTGAAALEAAVSLRPDVVLLDLRLPDRPGAEVCREIRSRDLARRVIVLTSFADESLVLEAMRAGADGYLLKDAEDTDLAEMIVRAAGGSVMLDPTVARIYVDGSRRVEAATRGPDPREGLSPQERRLLEGLAAGDSNKELAERLGLTDGTIRNYLSALYGKVGVRSRTEAVAWWLRAGDVAVQGSSDGGVSGAGPRVRPTADPTK